MFDCSLSKRILVVGAGFAGATYARELAEAGYEIVVIEKRPHIAGNAYDEVMPDGTRVHRYGPHLFHTSNERVVAWLSRFAAFIPYEHRVTALLPSGSLAPLPVNRSTVNMVFETALQTEAEVAAFLERIAVSCVSPRNAAEYLASRIGATLTELFFRPYTKKMWDLDLEEMDPAVVKRIPVRHDDEDRYFPNARFQILPSDGYTELVRNILDHPSIEVHTGLAFERAMLAEYDFCFTSMPIDEYFDFALGPLPYRSIRFHHRSEESHYVLGSTSVVNFTDAGPFTRQTDWSLLPNHYGGKGAARRLLLRNPAAMRTTATSGTIRSRHTMAATRRCMRATKP
jgi:UDP-galactopyranose mutase